MRFKNSDYLKAFPREEKQTQAAPATTKKVVKDEPGDVTDTSEDDKKPATPANDPEDSAEPDQEGGE